VPALTTFAGLYQRSAEHRGREPFDLPARWVGTRAAVNPDTPMNFVSTCDIIGGNSGSPTVNSKGEFVGIIFDGNIQSLSCPASCSFLKHGCGFVRFRPGVICGNPGIS
jgi:hypothetical protein